MRKKRNQNIGMISYFNNRVGNLVIKRFFENNIKIKMIISDEMFVGIDTEDDLKKAIKIFSEKDSI